MSKGLEDLLSLDPPKPKRKKKPKKRLYNIQIIFTGEASINVACADLTSAKLLALRMADDLYIAGECWQVDGVEEVNDVLDAEIERVVPV